MLIVLCTLFGCLDDLASDAVITAPGSEVPAGKRCGLLVQDRVYGRFVRIGHDVHFRGVLHRFELELPGKRQVLQLSGLTLFKIKLFIAVNRQ